MKRTMTAAAVGLALAGVVGAGVAVAATGDGPGGRLSDVLSSLVSKGTISQEAADAVEQAWTDEREKAMAEREQNRLERQGEVDALLQDTLGLTREQIRERIAAGETLREIAGDNADEFAAAMRKQLQEHLDEAVADGRMTQEQATEMQARSQERIQAWLDGDEVGLGRGFGLGLGRGMGGPGMGDGMGDGMGLGRGAHRGGGGFGMGGHGDGYLGGDEDASSTGTATTSA